MNATQQMAAFRPQMLSYAARQLGDDELAEDVVQDAFVAAFDRADAFRGEAALKTWVFAILKNKIADALRGRDDALAEKTLKALLQQLQDEIKRSQ